MLVASFPRLAEVRGTFGFYSANTTVIDTPSLETVGGDFHINRVSATRDFAFPSMRSVEGTVQLVGSAGDVSVAFGETRAFCITTPQIALGEVLLANNSNLTFDLFADAVLVAGDMFVTSNPGAAELNVSAGSPQRASS